MADDIKEKNVRFDKDMFAKIEKAAQREGIDASNYIRRCTVLYTREHHPDLFRDE